MIHKCPFCDNKIDSKTRFAITERFRLYGLSIQEIKLRLDFAHQHGYEHKKQPNDKE